MNNKIKMLVAATVIAAGVQQSNAIPIVGGLGFTGTYKSNVPNLRLATSITITKASVDTVSGAFTPPVLVGSLVAVAKPIILPPGLYTGPIALPVAPIWSVGGFKLTLSSFDQILDFPTAVTLVGLGIVDDGPGGFDPTPGDITLSFSRSGGATFTFAATSSAPPLTTPDGGATAMLLGFGFLGAAGLRRKLS